MQNIASYHPYVESVSITGHKITLRVEVTDFKTSTGGIEISGQATQNGGAFANISSIVDIATATVGDDGELFVTVTADSIPPYRFRKDQDVTIFVRVSKVWVTVLGEQSGVAQSYGKPQDAGDGTTWNQLRKVTQVNGENWQGQNAT
jgi:hypothetical protein